MWGEPVGVCGEIFISKQQVQERKNVGSGGCEHPGRWWSCLISEGWETQDTQNHLTVPSKFLLWHEAFTGRHPMLNSSKSKGTYWCWKMSCYVQTNDKNEPQLQGMYRINRQECDDGRETIAGRKGFAQHHKQGRSFAGQVHWPNCGAMHSKMYFPVSVVLWQKIRFTSISS